jgi:ComF family protein
MRIPSLLSLTRFILNTTHTCVLCHANANQAIDLCRPCQRALPWLRHACQLCGRELNHPDLTHCKHCLKSQPKHDKFIALYRYESPLPQLIMSAKFNRRQHTMHLLGCLMAEFLHDYYAQSSLPLPTLIIPVPLHISRLRGRGFNQALLLAQPIAKTLSLPIDFAHCQRIRATAAQATIEKQQRLKNINNAFHVSPGLQGQHIAVIDDVLTTGQTLSVFTHALKQAGVKKIDVWCCARTQWQF